MPLKSIDMELLTLFECSELKRRITNVDQLYLSCTFLLLATVHYTVDMFMLCFYFCCMYSVLFRLQMT